MLRINHFALLFNEELAITANLIGQLAIIRVPLGSANSCGTLTRKEVLPYSTSTSTYSHDFPFLMDTLLWEPFDIQAIVQGFPLITELLCEETPNPWPDTLTVLSLCPGDSLLADATHPMATSYRWPDGDTVARRNLVTEGNYAIQVEVGCLSYIHTFKVEASSPCECPKKPPTALVGLLPGGVNLKNSLIAGSNN